MGEVISTFVPPSKFESRFTQMQFVVDSLGRTSFRGVQNSVSTPVGEAKVLDAFGHKAGETEKPKQAIWKRGGDAEDLEVTIVGSFGIPKKYLSEDNADRFMLMEAEGRYEGIPRHQLEWEAEEPAEDVELDDSFQELRDQLTAIRTQMEQDKSEYQAKITDLGQRHTDEIKRLEDDFNQRIEQIQETHRSELEDKDRIIADRDAEIVRLREDLENGGPGFMERIGERIRYRSDAAKERRRTIAVTEIEEDREKNRRYGIGASIGALAAAAALAVGGAYLWGEHEEHEHQTSPPAKTIVSPPASPKASSGPSHTEEFKGSNGFKVRLPGSLIWKQIHTKRGDYYQIQKTDDQSPNDAVVKHVYWDQQGNLIRDDRDLLEFNGYKVSQSKPYPFKSVGKNGRIYRTHYETIVENS